MQMHKRRHQHNAILVDDDQLPEGHDWVIVVVEGERSVLFAKRSKLTVGMMAEVSNAVRHRRQMRDASRARAV